MLSPSATTTTMTDPLGPKIADLYQGDNARVGGTTAVQTTTPTQTSTRLAQALRRGSNGNGTFSRSNSNLNGFGARTGVNATANPGQLGRTERERSQMLRSISHLTKTQRPPTAPNEEEQIEWLNAAAGLSTAHVVSPPLVIPPPPEYDWQHTEQRDDDGGSHGPSSFLQRRNRSRSVGNLTACESGTDQGVFLRRSFSRSRSSFRAWASSSTANLTSPSVVSLHAGGTTTPTQGKQRKGSIPQLGRLAAAFRSRDSLFSKGSTSTSAPPPLPVPVPAGTRRGSDLEFTSSDNSHNLNSNQVAAAASSRDGGDDHDVDHRAAGTWAVELVSARTQTPRASSHLVQAQDDSSESGHGQAQATTAAGGQMHEQHEREQPGQAQAHYEYDQAHSHSHPSSASASLPEDEERGDGGSRSGTGDGRPASATPSPPTASRSSSSSTLPSSQQHSNNNTWTAHAGGDPALHAHTQPQPPITSILATSLSSIRNPPSTHTHPRSHRTQAGHSRQQSNASTASSLEGALPNRSPAAPSRASFSIASPLGFHDTASFRSPPRISFDLPAFTAYDNNSRAASRRPSVARLAMDTTPVREDPSELSPTMPAPADLVRDPSTSGVSFADTSAAATDSSNGHAGASGSIIDHGASYRLSHPTSPGIPAYPASARRVSLAPSAADDSTASSVSPADARRRSSAGPKLSKLKQWASRSSTNLAPSSPVPTSSTRKSMDVRAQPPAIHASPAPTSARKSISFFRSKDPRQDDAGLARFRRSSFMKSRTSVAAQGDDDASTPDAGRRKSSLAGGSSGSGWLGKVLRGASGPTKPFPSSASTSRRTSTQQPRSDATTPSTRDVVTAPSSTLPSPLPSSEEAQRDFDYAFGPVQTQGARSSPLPSGLPPSSQQAMPFSFKVDPRDTSRAQTHRPQSEPQNEVGPMGEPLTPPEDRPHQAPHHLHTGPFFSNETRSSLSSANQSHSTSPSSAQTQHTHLTLPASKPNTPAATAPPGDATALPGTTLVHSITDDDLRSNMSRTVSEDELASDALVADEFVDAVEIPPSDSAGAISAITATEGPGSSLTHADGDNDEGSATHDRLSSLATVPASQSADPPRRPGRTRSHLSHLPRLNSQRVLQRAEGGDGSDGEDETSRDSGQSPGGSGGGGGGGGGRRNGAHESEDGSETETADEDEDSETDTDGEDDHEQDHGRDHSQTASAGQEVPNPGAFAAPAQVNPAAARMALSFSRDRPNRPGDIALPPAPTFTVPSKTTQDTPVAPASVAKPSLWQNNVESPAVGAATTRASWMQFTETPFETPTPMASGAGGINGHSNSIASASKTPSVSSHTSQEPSYFTVRPAAPRNAANVQGSNMPPPSPSIISRNRAPSSSSVRATRIVPTPGRELPPVPLIQPQHLKALAAANQQNAAVASSTPAQQASPALSTSRDRPATALGDTLAPARGPRTPTSVSGNSTTRDSSIERLGASTASIGSANGYRPGLYHQASRSLIDLPSAARQRDTFHEPYAQPPPTPKQEQVPGTPDFAARPPPTPKGGLMPELVAPTSTLSAPAMQRRRSMIEIAAVPPPYAIIHRRPEGPQMIFPREEEGQEKLPKYGCSVHIEGYLPRKMEFSSPSVQARDRSWKRCYFVLHGTCLKVFRNDLSSAPRPDWGLTKGQHVHPDPINEDGSNGGAGSTPGANLIEAMSHTSLPFGRGDDSKGGIVREYTLQGAESGLAADYLKRRHVVRVRAEGEQFLLQTTNDRHLVDWIECLQAGTNIAADLEVRQMPKFITLPRRRRRRRPREAEAQEQADLAEAQRRSLADGGRGGAGSSSRGGAASAGRTSVSGRGGGGAATPDPSARFDEMLREEHEQMGRTTGTDAVI